MTVAALAERAAVFARTYGDGPAVRVSDWLPWLDASELYTTLGDPYRPGGRSLTVNGVDVHNLAVRSDQDPSFNTCDVGELVDVIAERRRLRIEQRALDAAALGYVKLTRDERCTIDAKTRRYLREHCRRPGWGLDDASAFIANEINELGLFDHLDYLELSSYAWGFAKFICPVEAREDRWS